MRILFHVDDSPHWHPLARVLADLVRATDGHVTVVSSQWSAHARRSAFEKAERLLALPPHQRATLERPGLVENTLPEEARRGPYDLVVVGRLGSLDWLTNGLVASLLVRRIPTSVLVQRGRLERVARVLVATAGPRHGMANVDAGLAFARGVGAETTVLHVLAEIALTEAGEEALDVILGSFLETDRPEARHLREVEARMAAAGVVGEVKVRLGPVVDETLAELRERHHDLLVLGAHEAEEATSGILYENVAALLLRASPVSFLVVRASPPRAPPP